MKYEIIADYLPYYPGVKMQRRQAFALSKVGFVVAHDTGNPNSTAKGNVTYYKNSAKTAYASAHIFVDDKEIRECVPLLTGKPEKANHVIYNVTTDNIMFGDDANDIAGGVEYCFGSNINSDEAYKRFVWVLAYICYKFNLKPTSSVVGHFILDPGRKIDPENGLSKSGRSYSQLLIDVVTEYNNCIAEEIKPTSVKSSVKTNTQVVSGEKIPTQKPVRPYPGLIVKGSKLTNDVKAIQRAVKVSPDGIFGPATEAAVKAYQKRHNLVTDGKVGKLTWNVMF